jgi:Xaa-Pro aminopeptidase
MGLAPLEIVEARLAALRRRLTAAGFDALVVTHLPNLFYLTNIETSAGVGLVTPTRLYLITDFRYSAAVEELRLAGAASHVTAAFVPHAADRALPDLLVREGVRMVAVEAGHMTCGRLESLQGRLAAEAAWTGHVSPTTRAVEAGRRVKDAHELTLLREAGRRLSEVARSLPGEVVRGGRSEADVAADIDWRVRRAGFARAAFDTIVASGPRSAWPHARPTSRCLQAGDLVVVDFGGVFEGYSVDLTRTMVVGSPTAEAGRLHRAVFAAQEAALAAVRAGALAHEVDAAAREALTGDGLGQAFAHATGHGLGLEVHEEPRIGQLVDGALPDRLEAGVVCTIEPGAYVPGVGGVRIEDDICVTESGYELLTDACRALQSV